MSQAGWAVCDQWGWSRRLHWLERGGGEFYLRYFELVYVCLLVSKVRYFKWDFVKRNNSIIIKCTSADNCKQLCNSAVLKTNTWLWHFTWCFDCSIKDCLCLYILKVKLFICGKYFQCLFIYYELFWSDVPSILSLFIPEAWGSSACISAPGA